MSAAVEVIGWPRGRMTDRDVREQFGDPRDIRTFHQTKDAMCIVYETDDAARRAVRMLNGSMPAGCSQQLQLRMACTECFAKDARIEQLEAAARHGSHVFNASIRV